MLELFFSKFRFLIKNPAYYRDLLHLVTDSRENLPLKRSRTQVQKDQVQFKMNI